MREGLRGRQCRQDGTYEAFCAVVVCCAEICVDIHKTFFVYLKARFDPSDSPIFVDSMALFANAAKLQ